MIQSGADDTFETDVDPGGNLVFQIFAKENCEVCDKARKGLAAVGVEAEVRYVDGPKVTPSALADFAWFDWTDKPPLVVVTDGERVLKRWCGPEIADKKRPWLPQVRRLIESHGGKSTGRA